MRKTTQLLAISGLAVMLTVVGANAEADAAMFMKLGDIKGEATAKGHEQWIELSSFQCGIDNAQNKNPGEKGGTADINIGVGELQECTVSKSVDSSSTQLAQFAINGNSPGQAEIDFVEVGGSSDGQPVTYLKYKLDRVFVKSWSISGDADDRPTEEVAFYYNKIAFAYTPEDEPRPEPTNVMSWDNVKNIPWDVFFEPIRDLFSPPGKSK